MDFSQTIASQLNITPHQVGVTIELLDSENTLPFIARYRKEATGGLDEQQLWRIRELFNKLRALNDRRQTVLKSIEEQGKLTPELKIQIQLAETMTALEDLYQPYKPKRRTRASIALEKGLQPLADLILKQPVYPKPTKTTRQYQQELVAPFINKDVPTEEDAWTGARDIVAETISDDPSIRGETRQKALLWGSLRSEKIHGAEDSRGVYSLYYDFNFHADRMKPHQVLAINRGEKENILRVKIEMLERDWRNAITAIYCPNRLSPLAEQLDLATNDAAERLLLPAIERDVRRELTEKAEHHAIRIFGENLRALLNQPPLVGHTVLGIDPGYRTGCKVAVVDPTGKVLEIETIYPHEPQKQKEQTLKALTGLVTQHTVTLITIGNGTASRETEALVAELIQAQPGLKYLIVNEAGASVYSASPLARAELPDIDVSIRGAVSIARRIQDPLAELVKIDPKSIGVGLYQHDVDQKQLADTLTSVVESVVNQVGVDANTASPALLTYVSGIGPKLAEHIVATRNEHGPFKNRNEFLNVPGLGPKAFEQAAGFLRIHGGENPLDASAIHPESYLIAEAVLYKAGINETIPPAQRKPALDALLKRQHLSKLAAELDTGEMTLSDIFEQLVRPGRDPREDASAPVLRSDILKIEDLSPGMRLQGTVRNVVDFGAFIDVGVKQDGLLHRSQIPPGIVLKVGEVIDVLITKVEIDRNRIGFGWAK